MKANKYDLNLRNLQNMAIATLAVMLYFATLIASVNNAVAEEIKPQSSIAMIGKSELSSDYPSFPYANPLAPQGGNIRVGVLGSFDTLNPFTVRGKAAANLRGLVYQSLMNRSWAEPFSLYSLVAKSVLLPENRKWIQFNIDERAKFSDGEAINSDDIAFSIKVLRDKARPNFANLYNKISKISIISEKQIRFDFAEGAGREIPLLIALMPILPAHSTDYDNFSKTTTAIPIGSGPYVVSSFEVGRNITYSKNPNYWAKEVASVKGLFNFDTFIYDYYRDSTSIKQAFKAGNVDLMPLHSPGAIAEIKNFMKSNFGKIGLKSYKVTAPTGMNGLVMNSRKNPFNNQKVRLAITLLFDYESTNKLFYDNKYKVIKSYWDRSDFSSCGKKISAEFAAMTEDKISNLNKTYLSADCFNPANSSLNSIRKRRKIARKLLIDAGYEIKNGRWIDRKNNQPLSFEAVYYSLDQEKTLLNFKKSLNSAGISINLRRLDSSQFQQRRSNFDYDMMPNRWYLSLSPGAEQYAYWGTDSATQNGSLNYMGVQDPLIDKLIGRLLKARTNQEISNTVSALDKVLLSGNWVVPLFYSPYSWVSFNKNLGLPNKGTIYGHFVESWWRSNK